MQIQTQQISGKKIHTWNIGASTFSASPENGARLMAWDIKLYNNPSRSIIYWPNNADLSEIDKIRGGNPILFPFVARTFNKGKENYWSYNKNILPMPRHGFARNGLFEVIEITESGFISKLIPKSEDNNIYPFNYSFFVEYIFNELSFTVNLTLKNHDSEPIPWCAGHHFYFTLPWHQDLDRSNYQINIPTKKAFYAGSDGKLKSTEDFSNPISFDDPNIIDRIHCKLKSNIITFGPKSEEEFIKITIGENPIPKTWNSLTTWTLDESSPFYCIEPWMGPPNSTEHKKGLSYVEPNEEETFTVTVSL